MKNKTLILTGCMGFIGVNFLKRMIRGGGLDDKYDKIISYDTGDLGDYNEELYSDLINKLDGIHYYRLKHIPPQPNETKYTVINFASISHVDASISHPFWVFKTNACLIPDLIETIGMENIERFHHIRTDEEFGELLNEPFDVNSEIKPRNPYSASKASQTLFLRSLVNTFGFPVSEYILSNQYGLHQHDSKFIPTCIKSIMDGDKIPVYGDGSNMRDWCFVEDTVDSIYKLVNQDAIELHSVYAVSNNYPIISNMEVIKTILKLMNKTGSIDEYISYVDDRAGHDVAYDLTSNIENSHFKKFEDGMLEVVRCITGCI